MDASGNHDDADTPDEFRKALGDRDFRTAADVLMRNHGTDVYRFCLDLLRDRDAAQDALQRVFVQAYEALPRDEPRTAERGWLFGIARHCCTDALEQGRGRQPEATLPESPDLGEAEPSPGWEDKVLSRIAEKTRTRAARRRTVLAAGSALIAAAAAGWLFFLRGERLPSQPTLAAVVRPHQPRQLRGAGVQPGDVIELTANPAVAASAEIRLYRNDSELVFRCPDPTHPPLRGQTCFVRSRLLVGTLAVPSAGVYQPVLITSARPFPEPTGNLQADSAQGLAAGAAVLLGPSIRAY